MIIDRTCLQTLYALLDSDADTSRAYLENIEPARFVGFCRAHQVAGTVYVLANELEGSEDWLPADLSAPLKESYIEQWAKNERLVAELKRLGEKTAAAGVDFIVLKGLPLAQRFYGNFDRREIHDIDLLVRKEDFCRGAEALLKSGYTTAFRYTLSKNLRFVHGVEFKRGDLSVDLHYALRVHPALRMEENDLWSERRSCSVGSASFFSPSDEWTLLSQLLSIHNDTSHGVITLRSYVDLFMVLRFLGETFDWTQFFERRKEDGGFIIAVNVLASFVTVFPFKQLTGRLAKVVRCHEEALVIPPDRETYLQLLEGNQTKLRRSWALHQYQAPFMKNLAWWMVVKPVCYALCDKAIVHRAGAFVRRQMAQREERSSCTTSSRLRIDGTPDPSFNEGILRFGSFITRFLYRRRLYVEMLEDLFRLEMAAPTELAGRYEFDAEIRMFDVTPESPESNSWLAAGSPRKPVVIQNPLTDALTIYYHDMAAHMSKKGRTWRIEVPVLSSYDDRDLLLHCVMVIFYRILYQLERIHLHAAAVRMDNRTGVFIGESGSGKSTLSLKLGLSGGVVLAEDHIVLHRLNGCYTVSGCDGNMRLTRKTEDEFFPGGLPFQPIKVGEVMKKEFPASDYVSCEPARDMPVHHVFFLDKGNEFSISSISVDEAMSLLVDAVEERYRFTDEADRSAFDGFISGWLESVQLHRLRLSPNLDDLDHLVSFL